MQKEQLQMISIDQIPERQMTKASLGAQDRQNARLRQSRASRRRRAQRKRRRGRCMTVILSSVLVLIALWGVSRIALPLVKEHAGGLRQQEVEKQKELLEASGNVYPQELMEMLEHNEETLDFVEGYGERIKWLGEDIDLSSEVTAGKVPLLMQWDRRWGYDTYGDGMVGWAGCGPVCMTMAYLYLTGDTSMDPRQMAEFADEGGYHTDNGTSWDFWISGAAALGLRGEELSLSESVMKNVLDNGGLVVCSMGPGDFTTTGHFILIWGYDGNGFYVNDPNRKSNSEKQWGFDQLQGQIKNLWGLYRG